MSGYLWIIILVVLTAVAGGVYYYYFRSGRKERVSPDESYIEALRALLDGNQTLAFLRLKETVTHDTTNIDAYLRLAALLRQRGMNQKALQLSNDLYLRENVSEAERVRILYNLAQDYESLEKYEAAERILKQISSMSGQKATATKKLINLYEKMGRWEEAYRAGEEYYGMSKIKDKSPLAKYKLKMGDRLMSDGEYHKARIEFKEALKLDPAYAEAVVRLGDAYEKEGRLEDAAKSWRMIIDVNAKKSELVFDRLQRVLFELGQFGEIEELYNRILERDKNNLSALAGLANLAEKKGDRQQAEEIYQQILDLDSHYRPALIGLLKLYREQNKFNEAAQVINRTVDTFSTPEN